MKKILIILLLLLLPIFLISCTNNNNEIEDNPVIEDPNDNEDPNTNFPDDEDPIIDEPQQDELLKEQALAILEDMTINEKVGQMFIVGFSGTKMPNSLSSAITNKKIGNFIYFGPNVTN